jgi:hypothetical protein
MYTLTLNQDPTLPGIVKSIADALLSRLLVDANYSSLHPASLVQMSWRDKDDPIQECDLVEGVLGKNLDCVGTALLFIREFRNRIQRTFNQGLFFPSLDVKVIVEIVDYLLDNLQILHLKQIAKKKKLSSTSHVAVSIVIEEYVLLVDARKCYVSHLLLDGDLCRSSEMTKYISSLKRRS